MQDSDRDQAVHQNHQKGDPIHSSCLGYLNHGKGHILGIAEIFPWKSSEQNRSKILQCDPEGWSENKNVPSGFPSDQRQERGKSTYIEAEIEGERNQDDQTDGDRDPSIAVYGYNDPVENSCERDKACHPPESETLQGGLALQTEKERDKGNPRQDAEREMGRQDTERIGKTQNQKNS